MTISGRFCLNLLFRLSARMLPNLPAGACRALLSSCCWLMTHLGLSCVEHQCSRNRSLRQWTVFREVTEFLFSLYSGAWKADGHFSGSGHFSEKHDAGPANGCV